MTKQILIQIAINELNIELAKVRTAANVLEYLTEWKTKVHQILKLSEIAFVYCPNGASNSRIIASQSTRELVQMTWLKGINLKSTHGDLLVEDNTGKRWRVFCFFATNGTAGVAITDGLSHFEDYDNLQSFLPLAGIALNLYDLYQTQVSIEETLNDNRVVDTSLENAQSDDVLSIADSLLTVLTGGLLDFDFAMVTLVYQAEERTNSIKFRTKGHYKDAQLRGMGDASSYPLYHDDYDAYTIRRARDALVADTPYYGEYVTKYSRHFDRALYDKYGHKSLIRLWSPMCFKGDPVGLVEVGYDRDAGTRESYSISEYQQQRVHRILQRYAPAIVNARRANEANVLANLARHLAIPDIKVESLSDFLREALEQLGMISEGLFFAIATDNNRLSRPRISYKADGIKTFEVARIETLCKYVWTHGRTSIGGTEDNGRPFVLPSNEQHNIDITIYPDLPASWVASPLIYSGNKIGCWGLINFDPPANVVNLNQKLTFTHPKFRVYSVEILTELSTHLAAFLASWLKKAGEVERRSRM